MDCRAEPYFRFVAADFQRTNHFAMAPTKGILSMKPSHLIFHQGNKKIAISFARNGYHQILAGLFNLYFFFSSSERIFFTKDAVAPVNDAPCP